MRTFRVIYLSKDNTQRRQRDFRDENEALNFFAKHGPERATIWETAEHFAPLTENGHEFTQKQTKGDRRP